MQKFVVGGYWEARRDSLATCADDAQRFFTRLAKLDPLLTDWYERGASRKEALTERVDTSNVRTLEDLLRKGRNRRDVDGEAIDDLGFGLGLWNEAEDKEAEASLTVHCGSYNARVGNNVLIHLPSRTGSRWVDDPAAILALVAQVWRPRWAGLMSNKAMRDRAFNAARPFVDWMVYVPRPLDTLPLPARVQALAGLGSIVVLQAGPPVESGMTCRWSAESKNF